MESLGRYCCFFCPASDYRFRGLHELCATCNRPFGHPLLEPPDEIGEYKVIRPLGRGFYAATFVAERKFGLRSRVVLKVSPKSFYTAFRDKDFQKECETHLSVSEGTEHLVKIRNMSEATVRFGDESLECFIAELDYVDGDLLASYLSGKSRVTAGIAAQIAIDLLRLREELEKKSAFHNDLHPGNIIIERLTNERFRADAVDPSIRTVAIDLGSVTNQSKSDRTEERLGDLHQIGTHIVGLVETLLHDPDHISDHDFRLASALQNVFHVLAAPAENQRIPAAAELIDQIKSAYEMLPRHAWRPWQQPLQLSSIGSFYNAQTLQSWHVPALLVDPEGAWLHQISTPGPQVITGMRGCGKTMLLRALQFHARASRTQKEPVEAVLSRIEGDSFIGLFVSAQRLLDKPGLAAEKNGEPFVRLFLAYVLESVRALMHLKDVAPEMAVGVAHKILAETVKDVLSPTSDLSGVIDLDDLDFRLSKMLVQHSRRSDLYHIEQHPSDAFSRLAEAIRRCSEYWTNAHVLFLLDDVSTRYLKGARIRQILSALMFQSPICAFKMTSEVQTMELELTTPGENLRAREGRDLSVFDLGSEVYDRIKGRNGKSFLEKILLQRAAHFSAHPHQTPSEILGDLSLQRIAREIAESSSTSRRRKEVYRGITALAQVCVGDIGDVISLYERILKASKGKFPVAPRIQTDCFQDHCSHRLYDLNRRGGKLKDVARAFAEASYELLVKSARTSEGDNSAPKRLRQYAAIYIRVTTGDTGTQMAQLRELIDAGVFVFTGGRPRTKTKDSDPILQFKLSFRRIYGLTNFIGLAERDRFELSGAGLEEWLADPSGGKEVLLRNLGGGIEGEDSVDIDSMNDLDSANDGDESPVQLDEPTLFDHVAAGIRSERTPHPIGSRVKGAVFNAHQISLGDVQEYKPSTIVLGLGFEDRTLRSVQRLVRALPKSRVVAVQYKEDGKSEDILTELSGWATDLQLVSYEDATKSGLTLESAPVLVDITGLAKPVIFHAVRNSLQMHNNVLIAHTEAKGYYPIESELKPLLDAEVAHDRKVFFEALSEIVTGEIGPYECVPLIESDADQTRRRVIIAFASPKHERLLSLLDNRDFDRLDVIAASGRSARNRVARQIAEIAATDNANSDVTCLGSNDLSRTIDFLLRGFEKWYVQEGFNYEIGLTGSKIQTVAAAAVSSAYKVTQCWYVRPQRFDPERFTTGSGKTKFSIIQSTSERSP